MTFTTLPAFTYFPKTIVDGERPAPASVGSGRLVALLVMAATGSAYFAAVVNHRLILSPDLAKYPLSKRCIVMLIDALMRLGPLDLPLTDSFFSKSPCVFDLAIVAEPQPSARVWKCCRIQRMIG
jgi:hypothetical protein